MRPAGSQGSASALILTSCSTAHIQALNISDHYPVEVELKLSQAAQQIRPLSLTTLLLPSLLLPLLPLQLGPVA